MVRLSKILEGIISQTAFDLARDGVTVSPKDYLMLSIIKSEGSLACRLLHKMTADWQLYQIVLRLERMLMAQPSSDCNTMEFFAQYCEQLSAQYSYDHNRVSTIDAVREILSDPATLSSTIFARYGITPQAIDSQLEKLAG